MSSDLEKTLIMLSNTAGYLYLLLAMTGILLNAYVITRLIQLAIKDYYRFKSGCGLPLAAMSISDLCSLVSIILIVVISGFLPQNTLSSMMHSAHCKVTLYMIHTLTGFSTWCWLFMSALRYIAVYHPLWHVTGKSLGPKTILIMILVMLVLNCWLPVVVVYYPIGRTCEEQALSAGPHWNRMLHALELLWSYLLPAILTLALDIKVILVPPPSFGNSARKKNLSGQRSKTPLSVRSATSEEWETSIVNKLINTFCMGLCIPRRPMPKISVINENEEKKSVEKVQVYRKSSKNKEPKSTAYAQHSWQSTCSRTGPVGSTRRGRQTVRQWLAITTIHLLLNAPEHILRLIDLVHATPQVYTPTSHIISLVIRLLYFAQFCFNAAYLSAIVYRKNIRPERKQITPKTSHANLQLHPEYSRPQTRVGIRDESRRQSRCHAELLRRYSVDPRSLRDPNLKHHTHLQVNQPLRSAPLLCSYSNETLKSDEFELNSRGSIANLSLSHSPSTEPRNDNISQFSSGDHTSGLVTFASTNGTNTPILCSRLQSAQEEWVPKKKAENMLPTMQENLWNI